MAVNNKVLIIGTAIIWLHVRTKRRGVRGWGGGVKTSDAWTKPIKLNLQGMLWASRLS